MNKTLKQNILDSIHIMYEAHGIIEKLYREKNDGELEEVLANCQEMAISIGNTIEESEGVLLGVIKSLEEYCEELYQTALNCRANNMSSKLKKKLDKRLMVAENLVINDIVTRTEVVFMPYKASMWDSLESIWKAACEDDECEAYVVPIPYYDKNPDLSLGKYNYEGELFPEYVPITDYKVFDLEARKPDVIYIHNPYDDCNYVTSVDPKFYSWELKKHTNCLVYVPYCLHDEPKDPDNIESIKSFSRYCLPVMINADKILLQSENLKVLAINTMKEFFKNREINWEGKILAFDSPKFDKVMYYDESDIPEEWLQKVTSSDGKRKKVVVYNTSLGSLLKENQKMIKKIDNVLKYFEKNKEEYTLVWRPHPLIESTIKSMRPSLYSEYKKIVNQYQQQDWGIFDATADYSKSFFLSDIYYGDYSSLIPLYHATGKPVLKQNVDVLNYSKKLIMPKIYYDGEYFWTISLEFNGLFRIEPGTFKLEFMGYFPGEDLGGYCLYYGIEEVNNQLYFCPYNAKNISVYDKKKNEFQTIAIPENLASVEAKFSQILVLGKYLYLQGRNIDSIVRIDSETKELTYISGWKHYFENNRDDTNILSCGCIHNGKVYFLYPRIKSFIRVDPEKDGYELIKINKYQGEVALLQSDGEKIWILKKPNGGISYFDSSNNELVVVADHIKEASCLCLLNEKIFIFCESYPYMYCVDIKSNELKVIDYNKAIYPAIVFDNKLLNVKKWTCILDVFNPEDNSYESNEMIIGDCEIPDADVFKMIKSQKEKIKYAREHGFLNIDSVMRQLSQSETGNNRKIQTNGLKIHEYIKGEIS